MNQDRNQPRYPSEPRDVRRPRHDFEGERYQGRGDERSDEARETGPRYGDRREYSYGDDFGSERSYGSRQGAQRGEGDDGDRERSGRSSSSYPSYDDDRGRQHESPDSRHSYGAPGQSYGRTQDSSWGGSFGGNMGSHGAVGQGFGGRNYYGGQSQGQSQYQSGSPAQYGGRQGSSQRSGDGESWGSPRESRGWGNGEGSASQYGGSYRRSSQPYSGSGMSSSDSSSSSTLYGPYTGKGPKNYRRSDQAITEEVNQALERHGEIDASEIEVTCSNGVVKLSGKVDDRRSKRLAEECVERIYGVSDVMNELKVDKGFFANLFGTSSNSSRSSTPSAEAGSESSDDRSQSRSPSSKPFQKNT